MSGSSIAIADAIAACDHVGDELGAAICEAVGAMLTITGCPSTQRAQTRPAGAVDRCRRLGLDALAWWIELSRLDESDEHGAESARAVEYEARRRGATAVASLARCAASALDDPHVTLTGPVERLTTDYDLLVDTWLQGLLRPDPEPAAVSADDTTPLTVRCFGGLEIADGDRLIDLTEVRPRARSVLALLAVHGGTPVHRDVICGELWPDDDVDTATRKLHVAVSSIRKVLREATSHQVVERHGESYELAARPGLIVDVAEFWRHVGAASTAVTDGRDGAAAAERALSLRGELLPEFGPVDWLVEPRRHIDAASVRLATQRAQTLVAAGDAGGAALWCRRGLEIDPWSDQLWRLLLDTLERADDRAALARARRDYDDVLSGLGVG